MTSIYEMQIMTSELSRHENFSFPPLPYFVNSVAHFVAVYLSLPNLPLLQKLNTAAKHFVNSCLQNTPVLQASRSRAC